MEGQTKSENAFSILFYPGKGGGNEPVRRVLKEKSYIREWAGKTFALILPLSLLKSRFLLPK